MAKKNKEKKVKQKKAKAPSTLTQAFRRMMGLSPLQSSLDLYTEEEGRSPLQTIVSNFFHNKMAVIGLCIFLFFFLFCTIYPMFYPLDLTQQDVTQQNLPPSFQMLKVPNELKNDAIDFSVGGGFSVGIDKNGKLFQWGNLTDKLKNTPKNMGKLVAVSAGLDHALALDEDGNIYTWGNNRLGLAALPVDLQFENSPIKQILAGYQISMALTESGRLYVWGNQNIMNVSVGAYNGNIEKVAANTTTAFVITKDGEVAALTKIDSPFIRIPEEVQGRTVDIVASDSNVFALLDDGTIVSWGYPDSRAVVVPEEIQGHATEISAGRAHVTVLLDDGSIASWGDNSFGQSAAPRGNDYEQIFCGYHQNYAIDSDGTVHTWGLKGYLMGSDQYGRDIFSRLVTGGRLTLTIGAISVIISGVLGILVGGFAGYYGGMVDNILMRIAEIVSAIPFLPLAIILSGIVGSKMSQTARIALIMVLLGVLSWPSLARIVRAQILAEREKEFVTAAKAMGVREFAIIFRHIFPNVITVVLVNLTLSFATCMITESTLSWLGFGVVEPYATWGNMLTATQSSKVIGDYWWRWVFPAGALSICSISINMIGDGLREAIDPKSQGR